MSLHYLVKNECWNQKKWHQSEIFIVINDKSQSSVAKHLWCNELLYYTVIIHFAGERIFEIGKHLAKLQGKWLTVCFTYCNFLNTVFLQGSVATRLACGGVFKYDCVKNFLLSLTVK